MEQKRDPKERLVRHYLTQAESDLATQNLASAAEKFKEALNVDGDHPERTDTIRQMLKDYSEQAAEAAPPAWNTIHETFTILDTLSLQNDETRTHQRELTLREIRYLLENEDDLDQSFGFIGNLLTITDRLGNQPQLRERVAQVLHDYVSTRAAERQWHLVGRVFERVKAIWPAGDTSQIWFDAMLQVINTAGGAEDGYQTEINQLETMLADERRDFERRSNDLQTQTQNRIRQFNVILIGILFLVVIAYLLAFLLCN